MSCQLISHLKKIAEATNAEDAVKKEFVRRAEKGSLTRVENPLTHFCVYFAGYDPGSRQVFIGHHKKSGLWLFNGGHLDEGELPPEALEREAGEEWGKHIKLDGHYLPSLLTVTDIHHFTQQTCRTHYDIWYFIPLDKNTFHPDEGLLATEFYLTGWKPAEAARNFIRDANTLTALAEIEKLFSND